jgi:hypothetical protein
MTSLSAVHPVATRWRVLGQVVLKHGVAELVNTARLSQYTAAVRVSQERHQLPRQLAAESQPGSADRERPPCFRQHDLEPDGHPEHRPDGETVDDRWSGREHACDRDPARDAVRGRPDADAACGQPASDRTRDPASDAKRQPESNSHDRTQVRSADVHPGKNVRKPETQTEKQGKRETEC